MNSNTADSPLPEKRVQLPEPDMDNITVLTRELPNEPILPWHRYDSPWLESEEGSEEANGEAEAVGAASSDGVEQIESEDLEDEDTGAVDAAEAAIAPTPSSTSEPNLDESEPEKGAIAPDAGSPATPNGISSDPQLDQGNGLPAVEVDSVIPPEEASSSPDVPRNLEEASHAVGETPPTTPVLPYLTPTHAEPRVEDLAPTPESEH